MRWLTGCLIYIGMMITIWGCAPAPGDRLARCGDEIVAAGQFFHTGTPVVLWLDPAGYDAYRCRRHFEPSQIMPTNPEAQDDPNRYGTRGGLSEDLGGRINREGWTLENLQAVVQQFVIHYDACGTSQRCFEILHDVHFAEGDQAFLFDFAVHFQPNLFDFGVALPQVARHEPAHGDHSAVLVEPACHAHEADPLCRIAREQQDVRSPVARVARVAL